MPPEEKEVVVNRTGMSIRSIDGGSVLAAEGLQARSLAVDGDRIVDDASVDRPGIAVDATGLIVAPGLIEGQINGAYGEDFTEDPESIWRVGRRLPEQGVTSFVPTIISSPLDTVRRARAVIVDGPPRGYAGATPIGLHCEGPMLSPNHRGTHRLANLAPPSLDIVEGWYPAGGVVMVTIAPELPAALDVIAELSQRGIVVAIGHSGATYEQVQDAFSAGATVGTHLYNAMSGFHHRAPGLVGALLGERDVVAGIIVDGIHSHPAAVRIAWMAKGPRHLMPVTDALAAAGMPYGEYRIGDIAVTYDESGARNESGELSGSVLMLDQAVRNLIEFTGCSVQDALGSVTVVPARLFALHDRGRIDTGAVADVVLLDDRMEVAMTIVAGTIAYERPDGVHGDRETAVLVPEG